MSSFQKSRHSLLGSLCLAVFLVAVPQAGWAEGPDVRKPDCAALEEWAAGIDGKDHWLPIEGYRGWLPRAFQESAFAELFGAPALEWHSSQAVEIAGHVLDCGRQAGDAKRIEARNALMAARGYLQGNLRGVLGRQEKMAARAERDAAREAKRKAQEAERLREQAARAQARDEARQQERDAAVEAALAALLEQPASPRLLRSLALLQAVDISDRAQFERVQRRVGPAARNLMVRLDQQGSNLQDPRVAPKIAARHAAVRDEVVADYRQKVAGLNDSTESLRLLAGWEQEVGRQLVALLGQEATASLLEEMQARRGAIQQGIFLRAKALIDAADDNTGSDLEELELIDLIVANSAKAGLTREQLAAVSDHASARQQVLAGSLLDSARARLDSYPETLDGLDRLRRDLGAAARGPLRRAGQAAFGDYMAAGRTRLTEIAEAALPEFERGLAGLPETAEGLDMADSTLVGEEGFDLVGEAVRADYLAAVDDRRATIAAALTAQQAARREAAIAAGGDPDLVGYSFIDREHFTQLEFRDEKLVIMNVMGMRAAADYQISAEDVIVRGPNGVLVLARSGSGESLNLRGMGLTLTRAAD